MLPYGVSRPNLSPACYDASGNRPLVAIWGDSHSSALAPGLRFVANAKGYGVVELDKSSCPPLTGATRYVPEQPTLASDCLHFNQEVLAILDKDRSIQLVVLAGYWEVPFHRNAKDGWLTADLANEHEIPTLAASSKLFEDALAATVESLQNAGKRVVVLEDVPMFDPDPLWRVRTGGIPARRDLARWLNIPDGDGPGFASPKVSPSAIAAELLLRQTIAGLPDAELVDPKSALCRNPTECAYRDGDQLLYADAQHLSVNGAKYALRDFTLPAANWQAISFGK